MATLRDIRVRETQRKIAVMQAYADGKTILTRSTITGEVDWHVIDYPSWAWTHNDYKVQDEPAAV